MTYNPKIHHRRSIRLKGYNYSQPGAYFVTICTQNGKHLFGNIQNSTMQLNHSGQMLEKWFRELEKKFIHIQCDEYICMPNHVHFIIFITTPSLPSENFSTPTKDRYKFPKDNDLAVGADLRVCPESNLPPYDIELKIMDKFSKFKKGEAYEGEAYEGEAYEGEAYEGEAKKGEHVGSPVPNIVQWFKTMTTNEYIRGVKLLGWPSFPGRLWHRNYYEHIIRDELDLKRIRKYIVNNPAKWASDRFSNNSIDFL